MNDKKLRFTLLRGKPIFIENIGYLHQITLGELEAVGEDTYNKYLMILTMDKNSLEVTIEEDIDNLSLVCWYCLNDLNFRKTFLEALEFFFKKQAGFDEESFLFYLIEEDGDVRIFNAEIYKEVQDIIRIANWVNKKEEEEYNPANEQARKIIEMIKQNKKNKPQPKPIIDLYSMVSGLAWKSNDANIFNVWDLTIYQLYDAFYRLENIEYCNNVMAGLYAGTVDGKNLDMKQINWAKILEI